MLKRPNAPLLCVSGLIASIALLSAAPDGARADLYEVGDIVVGDSNRDKIYRYDPNTGAPSVIAEDGVAAPTSLAFSPAGELIAIDISTDPEPSIYRVDAVTGALTTIISQGLTTSMKGVATDRCGNLFVTNGSPPKIYRVDAVTQVMTVVSEGGYLLYPIEIDVGDDGNLYVVDASTNTVITIDPTTGSQVKVAADGYFLSPNDLVTTPSGAIYVVDDGDPNRIIQIDPDAYDQGNPIANQTIVASGGYFRHPWTVALEASGEIIVGDGGPVIGGTDGRIVRVDPSAYNPVHETANQVLVASGSQVAYPISIGVVPPPSAPDPTCPEGGGPPTEYQKATVDVQLGAPDIIAKANELETPLRMFQYVHDEIGYEVYFGSKKGALGTLWSRRGNDYDQASLLIALLRSRGYEARYAIGVVEVDDDQLKQWAGVESAEEAKDRFEIQYCLHDVDRGLDFGTLGVCDTPFYQPKRFVRQDSSLRMEHAWVEVRLPTNYRGIDLGGSEQIWLPLDPSWKQKGYGARIDIPIGNETDPAGCSAGEICFDYDAYYAKIDPRLASEIWEAEIQAWLADPANPVESGKTTEDAIYDGPIVPYEGEVLPTSLPFVPLTSPAVMETADLTTLSGIERHFKVEVFSCLNGDCGSGSDVVEFGDFYFSELVGSRLTYEFVPTAVSRLYGFGVDFFYEYGGFLGREYGGSENVAAYCQSQSTPPPECEVEGRLIVGGETLIPHQAVADSLGRMSSYPLYVRHDLIPGVSIADILPSSEVPYYVKAGEYLAIGLDINAAGPDHIRSRVENLLSIQDTLSLVDEGDEDLNENTVFGEVLVDQGTPGITPCPDYYASGASTTCDFALAAHFNRKDGIIGELLNLAALRYSQRLHEERVRTLALDGFVANSLPNVIVAKAGLHFTYLFNQPVGVEPAAPTLSVRFEEVSPSPVNDLVPNDIPRLHREARLLAHVTSSLEHQSWEELIGSEFISTVKGIQLVGERFPEHPVIETDSGDFSSVRDELAAFPYDTISSNTLDLMEVFVGASATVFTPTAAVSDEGEPVEVFIAESTSSTGVALNMLITVGGEVLGGSVRPEGFLSQYDPATWGFDLFTPIEVRGGLLGFGAADIDASVPPPGDPVLTSAFLDGDPVSMVSGNLHHSEQDLFLPTDGPPFSLARTYNSRVADSGALGVGWTHSYEMRIEPARDVREFTYLPSAITGFAYQSRVEGPRSDTLDTSNRGYQTESVDWNALPAAFANKVDVESIALELAFAGTFRADPGTGQAEVELSGPASGPPRYERIPLTDGSGAPYTDLGALHLALNDFTFSGDRLYFARLRIRYRGPAVERVELVPETFSGWEGGSAPLEDDDPSTCLAPTNDQATIQFQSESLTDAFGFELLAAVQRSATGTGEPESALYRGTDTGEAFLTGPHTPDAARQRFITPSTDPFGFLLTFDRDLLDEGESRVHQLCRIKYRALTLPDQVELVLDDGARERFTRSGTDWIAAPGIRDRLEDLAAPRTGYVVTRPDGRKLTFEEPGADGAYRVTRIEDPQGRGLELSYNAATGKLETVYEPGVPERVLSFGYDANGYLSTVSDWSGRTWRYFVQGGDLVEVRDPLEVENEGAGWIGTKYEYSPSGNQNPHLDHNLTRILLPRGGSATSDGIHWVRFEYDQSDRVTSHTDSLGNRQTFLFNIPRQESQTTDARGFTTIYRHDAQGNLTQRVDPDGAMWSWEYDENRNVTREVDPFGIDRRFDDFDDRGNPAQLWDKTGREVSFSYDEASGAPDTIVDRRGKTRRIEFSGDGLPERIYAALGAGEVLLRENQYDPASRRLEKTLQPLGDDTPRQALATFYYTGANRDVDWIERSEDSDGDGDADVLLSLTDFDYDALGRKRKETLDRQAVPGDPSQRLSVVTEWEYDSRGQLTRLTRPDGVVVVSDYDRNGNLEEQYLEETPPGGGAPFTHSHTVYQYDAIDRLIEVTDPAGGVTSYEYDAVGNRTAVTDPEGNTTRIEYDAMNRPIRGIDPNGAVTTTEYDHLGRVIAVTDPTGLRTERRYDALGRLIELQQGDNDPAVRTISDAVGAIHEETLTDPELRDTKFTLDDLGRIVRVDDATGIGFTTTDYDLLGNPTRFTDSEGGVTDFVNDALGRVTEVTAPYAAGPRTTAYDEAGNPIRVTRPDGCAVEMSYDAMNRLLRRRSVDSTCPAATIEPVDDRFGYDSRGNLIAAKNPHVGLLRAYDANNRLVRETDDRFGTAVAYQYDAASRLTAKVYSDGSVVHVAYDGAGRPVGITDPFGDTTRYVYDAAGRRIQTRSTATGLRSDLQYDDLGRLAAIASYRADGAPAARFDYPDYDKLGNRKTEVRNGSETTTYAYDALYRLVTETPPGAAATHYEYDKAGNRLLSGAKDGSQQWIEPYLQYDYEPGAGATHRLSRVMEVGGAGATLEQFAYDANGRPTSWTRDGEPVPRTLRWDALGRLVAIDGGFEGRYAYDPFGRRIEKTESGETIAYQYDGLDVVAEYSKAGPPEDPYALEASYIFGAGIDEPIKLKRGATAAAYHTDGLGSVVSISEIADPAPELNAYAYDAFGNPDSPTEGVANAYTFTGREADASGLYYYRSRYYLAAVGRFLTPDPIGLRGGENPYSYVGSNPVNFTDPFGLLGQAAIEAASPSSAPGFFSPVSLALWSGDPSVFDATLGEGDVRLASADEGDSVVGWMSRRAESWLQLGRPFTIGPAISPIPWGIPASVSRVLPLGEPAQRSADFPIPSGEFRFEFLLEPKPANALQRAFDLFANYRGLIEITGQVVGPGGTVLGGFRVPESDIRLVEVLPKSTTVIVREWRGPFTIPEGSRLFLTVRNFGQVPVEVAPFAR